MNDQPSASDVHAKIEATIVEEYDAADTFRLAVQRAHHAEPGLPVNELWNRLFDELTDEELAQAFFQLVGFAIDPDTDRLTKRGKHFAIEVADLMGPDWTQGVYELGVAVARAAKH